MGQLSHIIFSLLNFYKIFFYGTIEALNMIYLSAKQEAKDKMKLKSNPKRFMKNKYQIINPILSRKHSTFYGILRC